MTILSHPAVTALLLAQCQVVARRQLLEVGITDRQIAWAIRPEGPMSSPLPGVYVPKSAPPSWKQSLWIARLAADFWSPVAHEAAARFHHYATYGSFSVPTFLVPHGSHHRVKGAVFHQTRDPWLVSTVLIDGLLVTSPERTFCDLAATTRRSRLALALDDAKVAKKITYESVGLEMKMLARHGKRGFRQLREILDERGPGFVPTNGELKRKTLGLYDQFGGKRLIVAWPYPTREQVAGCADFGDPKALLAVETDGRRWHQRIADAKRDHERDANAARHGVQVLRILWEHVTEDPRGTWELIEETRAVRLRQFGLAAS